MPAKLNIVDFLDYRGTKIRILEIPKPQDWKITSFEVDSLVVSTSKYIDGQHRELDKIILNVAGGGPSESLQKQVQDAGGEAVSHAFATNPYDLRNVRQLIYANYLIYRVPRPKLLAPKYAYLGTQEIKSSVELNFLFYECFGLAKSLRSIAFGKLGTEGGSFPNETAIEIGVMSAKLWIAQHPLKTKKGFDRIDFLIFDNGTMMQDPETHEDLPRAGHYGACLRDKYKADSQEEFEFIRHIRWEEKQKTKDEDEELYNDNDEDYGEERPVLRDIADSKEAAKKGYFSRKSTSRSLGRTSTMMSTSSSKSTPFKKSVAGSLKDMLGIGKQKQNLKDRYDLDSRRRKAIVVGLRTCGASTKTGSRAGGLSQRSQILWRRRGGQRRGVIGMLGGSRLFWTRGG